MTNLSEVACRNASGQKSQFLQLNIDADESLPLYRRVTNAIKDCIESGRLAPGDCLPSTRQLASILGVARITAVNSYDLLITQGYLKTAVGRGTFVSDSFRRSSAAAPQIALSRARTPVAESLSSYAVQLLQLPALTSTSADQAGLHFGAPPAELLPVKQWRRLLLQQCAGGQVEQNGFDVMGYQPLREALAAYLKRTRNLNCSADMIFLFSNSQQAVNLVSRLLIDQSDTVALENPGFVFASKTMQSIGAQIEPIAVDHQGMVIAQLNQLSNCKLAYVTPSHQDPTGAVMSQQRRYELLEWAARNKAYIIEDDYDCEYNYGNVPLAALQGLDRDQSVIYISSFWKTLYPLTSMGFMVAPPHLIPLIKRAKLLSERSFSALDQITLCRFINEGHLESHIARTRKILATRRQQLIFALTDSLGKRVQITKHGSGVHIITQFSLALSDEEILTTAKNAGLAMVSTTPYYLANPKPGEFLISFSGGSSIENLSLAVSEFSKQL